MIINVKHRLISMLPSFTRYGSKLGTPKIGWSRSLILTQVPKISTAPKGEHFTLGLLVSGLGPGLVADHTPAQAGAHAVEDHVMIMLL